MGKLKDCPTCGYKTTRDFCTPHCRMQDSDNRIESVEDERDKLKIENEKLRENLESLKKWHKGQKINFAGEDRFWKGYEDYHFNLKAKLKELEK